MEINWISYAVAAVAQMVIGFFWFHPAVIGKIWARANGLTSGHFKLVEITIIQWIYEQKS